MEDKKILQVIQLYRDYFIKKGIRPIDFSHDDLPCYDEQILGHCHGMLSKMEFFLKEGRRDKVFRWLGFIQGCLWSTRRYPLDDLKNHSRPDVG